MRLALGALPALGTHGFCILIGISASRLWMPVRPTGASGPGVGKALVSLPRSLASGFEPESLKRSHALALVKLTSPRKGPHCLLSDRIISHVRASPNWVVAVKNRDLGEFTTVFRKGQRSVRIISLPSHPALGPCPDKPGVIYGAF